MLQLANESYRKDVVVLRNDLKCTQRLVANKLAARLCNLRRVRMATQLTKDKFLKEIFDYENNKEWKFEGKLPAVIDFYADWCQPCKMVAPIIEELSKEYEGKVNFFKVDTEAQQELAGAFGIQSIPSLLFIPVDGKPQMAAGALPKASFVEVIEKELLVNATEA